METIRALLAFSDVHPALAVVFAATITTALIVAYKLAALAADTLLTLAGRPTVVRVRSGRGRGKLNRKVERVPADDGAEVLRQARAALAHLGYVKSEVEPALAQADLSEKLPEVVRAAIRKISESSGRAVA